MNGYFGGGFTVNGPTYTLARGSFNTRHPGAKVQLTLTSKGALIDGSHVKVDAPKPQADTPPVAAKGTSG